ncbi:serine aminopeptidase domain-containing protein [Dokdonella sp.]|uniref:alpha/beta hydrolase family protein n=1 Tax=Dokdonella sp. TaxID=2291710 RepID=UPI0035292E68
MPDPHKIRVRTDDGAESDLHLSHAPDSRFGLFWLPALGVTARHYLRFAETLAGMGISVAVHEWRGAGSSNLRASRQSDWGYRELLQFDIPAGLAAARAAMPDTRWILAGHSIGGQFACLHAASNPDASEALVLVACGSPYWKTFSSPRRWLLRLVPAAVSVATALYGYYPGKRIGFAGSEARTLMRDWAQSAKSGVYSRYLEGVDFENELGKYAKPLLNMRMEQDSLCPPESCEWLLGKMSSAEISRLSLAASEFEGRQASHFSWMKEPGPVARHIADWVHRRLEATGTAADVRPA